MINTLEQIKNTLGLVRTNGDDTIIMAKAMTDLHSLIETIKQEYVKQQEAMAAEAEADNADPEKPLN